MTKNQLNIKNKWKKTTRQKKPHLNVIDGKQTKKKLMKKVKTKKTVHVKVVNLKKRKKETNQPTVCVKRFCYETSNCYCN